MVFLPPGAGTVYVENGFNINIMVYQVSTLAKV